MNRWSFKREAQWMLWLSLALPLFALVVLTIGRIVRLFGWLHGPSA